MQSCPSKNAKPTDEDIASALEIGARNAVKQVLEQLTTDIVSNDLAIQLAAFNKDLMLIYLEELEAFTTEKKEQIYGKK
jgi:hypothetical protein